MEEYTKEQMNTEFDYMICDRLNITMDELDAMPLLFVKLHRDFEHTKYMLDQSKRS